MATNAHVSGLQHDINTLRRLARVPLNAAQALPMALPGFARHCQALVPCALPSITLHTTCMAECDNGFSISLAGPQYSAMCHTASYRVPLSCQHVSTQWGSRESQTTNRHFARNRRRGGWQDAATSTCQYYSSVWRDGSAQASFTSQTPHVPWALAVALPGVCSLVCHECLHVVPTRGRLSN